MVRGVDRIHTIGRTLIQESQGRLNLMTVGRKVGQAIVIGDSVTVTVIRISGSRVSFYIEAPGLHVTRTELGSPSGPPTKEGGLVLSRNTKRNEGIYIGPDILVEPLSYGNSNTVPIRTTLPRNMRIDREEVSEARLRELQELPEEEQDKNIGN